MFFCPLNFARHVLKSFDPQELASMRSSNELVLRPWFLGIARASSRNKNLRFLGFRFHWKGGTFCKA